MRARHDIDYGALRLLLPLCYGKLMIRSGYIQKMKGHTATFRCIRLCRADVHTAIHLHGIGIDDLSPNPVRQIQRRRRLTGGSRTYQNNRGNTWPGEYPGHLVAVCTPPIERFPSGKMPAQYSITPYNWQELGGRGVIRFTEMSWRRVKSCSQLSISPGFRVWIESAIKSEVCSRRASGVPVSAGKVA